MLRFLFIGSWAEHPGTATAFTNLGGSWSDLWRVSGTGWVRQFCFGSGKEIITDHNPDPLMWSMVLEYLYTNICPCPKSPSYVGNIPYMEHMGNRKMMKHEGSGAGNRSAWREVWMISGWQRQRLVKSTRTDSGRRVGGQAACEHLQDWIAWPGADIHSSWALNMGYPAW